MCDVRSARFSERQLTCYSVPCAAMMYPEFHYRPPPPSYQASMQDYRLRLLLLDRHPGSAAPGGHAVSPPPTYRSHSGSMLRYAMGVGGGHLDERTPISVTFQNFKNFL